MSMEERMRPTRSGLFSIELLIATGVFSLCAAICVGLFVRSEVISQRSADLNRAVTEARNMAECFKAAGGDLRRTAELTGTVLESENRLTALYDQDWQPVAGDCGTGIESLFLLELTRQEADGFASAELRVTGPVKAESLLVSDVLAQEGEALVSWNIAALEVRQ